MKTSEAARAIQTPGSNRKIVRFVDGKAEYGRLVGASHNVISVSFTADNRLERVPAEPWHFTHTPEDFERVIDEHTAVVVVSGLSDEEKAHVYEQVRILNERLANEHDSPEA